jgi:hypothetical protein
MCARTKSLILVLLVMVGPALEASATTVLPISHNWTFRVGGRKFGLTGYPPGFSIYRTSIWYGSGYFTTRLPAPMCVTLPLLVCAGGYLIVRRRNESAD